MDSLLLVKVKHIIITNDYLKELAKTNNGNLFYSPFSIHMIMFMASVGAASTTFDEMIKTIHLNKTTHSLEAYKNLLDELTVSILSLGIVRHN